MKSGGSAHNAKFWQGSLGNKESRMPGGCEIFRTNYYLAQQMMKVHTEEVLRRAEIRRLLREAGIDQRGWLSRQVHWLSCQLGRLLVALGQRLQRIESPQTLCPEGGSGGGASSLWGISGCEKGSAL